MLDPIPLAHASLQTNDFDQLCEAAEAWDQRYTQMSPGEFRGRIDLTQINGREVMRERWGRRIRYRGSPPPGTFALAFRLAGAGRVNWLGHDADRDGVVIQAPGIEAEFVGDDWDGFVLSVPEQEVISTISALRRTDIASRDIHGLGKLSPNGAGVLRAFANHLLNVAAAATSPDDAVMLDKLSQQYVRMLLLDLTTGFDAEWRQVSPTRPAQVVRKATDLVLANTGSTIGLTEICREAGVSLRTLHYAFQNVTGAPPASWLRRMRLNSVHRTLNRSAPAQALVKRVAIDHGFFHAGHFSAQYRRLFGCLPSETLRAG